MQHWYVYYKLPRAQIAETAARVRAMQDALAATTAVHGRLLRRVEDDVQTMTLMEQYDRIADPHAFAAGLATAVAGAGLPAPLLAQRRIERFEDC
jgi:hypothetical protein